MLKGAVRRASSSSARQRARSWSHCWPADTMREHAYAHSLWLRRAFFRDKRLRQLDFAAGDGPIEAFLAHWRKEALRSRRAASDVARVQHERAAKRPTSTDHAATHRAADKGRTLAVPSSTLPGLVSGPIKAASLRIDPGYSWWLQRLGLRPESHDRNLING